MKRAMKRAGMRDLCNICGQRPVAINYYKDGKAFYRSKCDHCSRNRNDGKPKWEVVGYKKKAACDKCGFVSKHPEQFNVYYVDGDPSNCRFSNLKTVCANCQRILHKLKMPWKQGDLKPDF
jgi:hypothetical protein